MDLGGKEERGAHLVTLGDLGNAKDGVQLSPPICFAQCLSDFPDQTFHIQLYRDGLKGGP